MMPRRGLGVIGLLAAAGLGARTARAQRVGTIRFPVSCRAAAQPGFDRAVALLHSFGFSQATQGFQAVLQTDPKCAMAWWGIALSAWEIGRAHV